MATHIRDVKARISATMAKARLAGLIEPIDQRPVGGFTLVISGIDDPPAVSAPALAQPVDDPFGD